MSGMFKKKVFDFFALGIVAAAVLTSLSAACNLDEPGREETDSATLSSVSETSELSSAGSSALSSTSSEPSFSVSEASEVSQEAPNSPSSASSELSSESSEPVHQGGSSALVPASAAVGDDYFSDALFIGDSLTHGLCIYGDIHTADYCHKTSATVSGIFNVTSLDSMLRSKSYGKIYILLGINEVGGDLEQYLSNYRSLLRKIRAVQPAAALYLQTLLPTNPSMTRDSSIFSVQNVTEKNRGLKQLAEEEGVYLLDLYSVYADEKGEMPAAYCRDGVHPYEAYYKNWCDYLRTHTV